MTATPSLADTLPRHWQLKRLKFIARVQTGMAKGKDHADADTVEVPYLRVANVQDGYLALDDVATMAVPVADLDRYRLQPGDVLMNEGGDFDKLGRGHVWHGQIDPCIHQNHVFAVRPHGVSPEWLNAWTGSAPAQFYFMGRAKQSTNLASISSSNVMELPVPVPPPEEQVARLAFINRETTRIDALIEKKTRFIALLREKRQALITQAVTRGLDPDVAMKDSGVEWLGRVPAHWEFGRIKRWFQTDSGGTPATGEFDLNYSTEGPHPWVRTTDLNNGMLFDTPVRLTERGFREAACNMFPSGTVLIAMYGGDGTVGKNAVLIFPACTNQALCAVLPSPMFDPKFFFWYVQHLRPYWMIDAASSRKDPNISQEQIRAMSVPCPPLAEQAAISANLEKRLTSIAKALEATDASIQLLKEHRVSLITATVTGQLDPCSQLT